MTDEPVPLPAPHEEVPEERDKVFEIGDRTVGVMRDQVFAFDEFGTYGTRSASRAIEIAVEKVPGDDTLHRVERKIDGAMRAISALQRRIESIDRVLSRLINRA
jgi:hypothetical protein